MVLATSGSASSRIRRNGVVVGTRRAERYRKLAAEARADATHAIDAYDKRTLLLVAQRYEVLAERARIREREKKGACT
jgi:hypothetical protein